VKYYNNNLVLTSGIAYPKKYLCFLCVDLLCSLHQQTETARNPVKRGMVNSTTIYIKMLV